MTPHDSNNRPLVMSCHRLISSIWHSARGGRAAYTMIEMLVVFGIVVIAFTAFGVAMRPTPGKNVRLAQVEVEGLYSVARFQALATQGNGRKTTDSDAARVLVYASKQDDNDYARYLREMRVVVPDPADPNNKWLTVGQPVMLPAGVFVIPPTSNVPMMPGVTWPGGTGRASKFNSMNSATSTSTASATQPLDMAIDGQPAKKFYFTRFSARATVQGFGDRVVLSEGRPRVPGDSDQEPVRFSNPQNLRGFSITQYGAVILLNDVQDFSP
jgi:type II secretory pathway pseudopilin PulG